MKTMTLIVLQRRIQIDPDFVLTQHPKERSHQGDAASYSKGDANKLFEYAQESVILLGQGHIYESSN